MLSLVTGGAGFFGSHLIEALLTRGEDVRVLDLANLDLPHLAQRVEVIHGDIRDPAAVAKACDGVDVVYHTASLVPLSKAGRGFADVNVQGTKCLLEMAAAAKVKKLVHLSSSSVYGIPQTLPITEEHDIRPLGQYGWAKYQAEQLFDEHRRQGLEVTIIRPRTIVGPRRLGIFHILFDWIKRGSRVWILGPGSERLQLLSARDLTNACILAAQRGGQTVYNIGAAEYGTLRSDLQALIDYAGSASRLTSLPPGLARLALRLLDKLNLSPLVDWHYQTIDKPFYFSLDKAQRQLGWRPQDANRDMLIESYDWFLKNSQQLEGAVGTTHRLAPDQGWLKFFRRL